MQKTNYEAKKRACCHPVRANHNFWVIRKLGRRIFLPRCNSGMMNNIAKAATYVNRRELARNRFFFGKWQSQGPWQGKNFDLCAMLKKHRYSNYQPTEQELLDITAWVANKTIELSQHVVRSHCFILPHRELLTRSGLLNIFLKYIIELPCLKGG